MGLYMTSFSEVSQDELNLRVEILNKIIWTNHLWTNAIYLHCRIHPKRNKQKKAKGSTKSCCPCGPHNPFVYILTSLDSPVSLHTVRTRQPSVLDRFKSVNDDPRFELLVASITSTCELPLECVKTRKKNSDTRSTLSLYNIPGIFCLHHPPKI